MAASHERLRAKYGVKSADPWIKFFEIAEEKGEEFAYPTVDQLSVRWYPNSDWTLADPEPKEKHVVAGTVLLS